MTDNGTLSEKYALLRREAEERVQKWPDTAHPSEADSHQMIQELKIHLAEQEILNEELRRLMTVRQDKDTARYESVRSMFWPLS